MTINRSIGIGFLFFLLVGCVNEPKNYDQLGQFSVYPLNENSFRISYVANDDIGYSTAQEIALIKASQTTVQHGFQYFRVFENATSVHQQPQKSVSYSFDYWGGWGSPTWWGPGWWGPDPMWGSNYYNMPEVVTVNPAEVAYDIQCYHKLDAPKDAFNATIILQTLGAKYNITPTGQVLPFYTPYQ